MAGNLVTLSAEREAQFREMLAGDWRLPTQTEAMLALQAAVAALDASCAQAGALAEAAEPIIEHEAKRLRIAQDELAFLGKTASPYARAIEKARDVLAAYRKGQAHSADDAQREADRAGA